MYRHQVLDRLQRLHTEWFEKSQQMTPTSMASDIAHANTLGILPLRVDTIVDKVYINGKGFRYLRRKYAYQKAEGKQDPLPLIPLAKVDGTYQEPIHNRVRPSGKVPYDIVGWTYTLEHDLPRVWAFYKAVQQLNQEVPVGKVEVVDTPGKRTTHGVIGIDIPYKEPDWIRKYAVGNPKYNPYITRNGTYYFGQASLYVRQVHKAVRKLHKLDFATWHALYYPLSLDHVSHRKKLRKLQEVEDFMVFNVAFDQHARTVVSLPDEKDTLWLIDPWKTSDIVKEEEGFQRILSSMSKGPAYKLIPQDKPADQHNEGSCVIISFARALWIAREGPAVALEHPIPYEYAILAIRLLRPRNKVVLKAPAWEEEAEEFDIASSRKKKQRDNRARTPDHRVVDEDDDLLDDDDLDAKQKAKKRKMPRKQVAPPNPNSIPSHGAEIHAKKVARVRSAPTNSNPPLESALRSCMVYPQHSLLRHQKRIVEFMMNTRQRGIILFHSMGSGKTITSIAVARCLALGTQKVIVATPSSIQKQFEKEVKQMGIHDVDFRVVTHHHLAKHPEEVTGDTVLVVDEAHNFRNSDGKLTQGALQAAARAAKVILASATPVVNHIPDFAILLAMVHGTTDPTPYINQLASGYNTRKGRALLTCATSYYRTPMDLKNFPSVSERYKTLRMDPAYYAKYLRIQQEEVGEVKNQQDAFKRTAFYMGIRRAANKIGELPSAKIAWAVEKIREEVQHNRKVAVFSAFLSNGLQILTTELEKHAISYVALEGSMTPSQRIQAIQQYNTGTVPVFIFTMAGAEGVDLKGTRTMLVMDPWWNSSKTNQIVGRVARYKSHTMLPPSERHVDIYYLVLKKPQERNPLDQLRLSADEILYRMAESKNEDIIRFYDVLHRLSAENCRKRGLGWNSA
jgi:superfamily II DNA or RNA helicase